MMQIENQRLIIEKFTESDVIAWSEIEKHPEVRRFIDGKIPTFEESKHYVKMNILHYKERGFGRYAVRLKKDHKLIGMCGFRQEEYGIDFGYRYYPTVWKNGIGFEAAKLVLDYGMNMLKINKIYGLTAAKNYGSIRILEKLGFNFIEEFIFNDVDALKYIIYKV